jgi:anti-sigma-K factor RskA
MNSKQSNHRANSDPLGLAALDDIEPGFDDWAAISSALKDHQQAQRRWRTGIVSLAVAASLILVIGLSVRGLQTHSPAETNLTELATTSEEPASVSVNEASANDEIEALIGLSGKMQAQVSQMRNRTASMPAESALYVAELEDLIAQVDNELSFTPDSIDLWGQRVNLLLDLAQVYQQQRQIDYGRMVSL